MVHIWIKHDKEGLQQEQNSNFNSKWVSRNCWWTQVGKCPFTLILGSQSPWIWCACVWKGTENHDPPYGCVRGPDPWCGGLMYLSLTCHQIFLLTWFCDIPFSLDLSWSLKLSLHTKFYDYKNPFKFWDSIFVEGMAWWAADKLGRMFA